MYNWNFQIRKIFPNQPARDILNDAKVSDHLLNAELTRTIALHVALLMVIQGCLVTCNFTTAGQRTTHYRESALWNGLRADLKDLSSPGAFRAAVGAGEL